MAVTLAFVKTVYRDCPVCGTELEFVLHGEPAGVRDGEILFDVTAAVPDHDCPRAR